MTPFEDYCHRKELAAIKAQLSGFYTISDTAAATGVLAIGNAWSLALFDGDFYRSTLNTDLPLVSLVFVQSKDGNTVADNPSTLGGGETDKHLVYEGLSRVDADGVLAGAATARSGRMVFSVWHPELVALRQAMGHSRHPAQIVITDVGDVPIERGLMFQEPSLPVFIVTRSAMVSSLRDRAGDRSWVEVVDAGEPLSLTTAMHHLWQRGQRVISAVGGRRTATTLLRERLVADLYLTTSPIEAGEPGTPYYEGPPLSLTRVVEKAGKGNERGIRFEHFLVG
jgi:riboflavin biosynthesis pyrimidine reductase